MQITLYGEDSEPVKTFTRSFVPWKLLKKAISLSKELKEGELNEADVDNIAALVVDAFGNQFTVDQLSNGADVGEMMTVLKAIISRAAGANNTNPTLPPG